MLVNRILVLGLGIGVGECHFADEPSQQENPSKAEAHKTEPNDVA